MAALGFTRSFAAESLFPAYSESCEGETSWTLKTFKKPYAPVGCALGWAEKLTASSTSRFFSERRKDLSKHSEMLKIPEWFQDAASLSKSVEKVKKAQGTLKKRDAAAELVINSVGLTKSSIEAARALNNAEVISLSGLSSALPPTLKGISSVAGLILRTSALYKQCMKTKKEFAKVPLKNVVEHLKQDKEAVWKAVSIIRVVGAFITAMLSVIAFFFAIKFSPWFALAFITFTCIASLVTDLREAFSSIDYSKTLAELA